MAVEKAGTVIRISADNDTIAGAFRVAGMLYIPGTGSPTAQLKRTDTSGMVLWESSGATRTWEDVEMYLPNDTYHFDLAGTGTVVYMYLCAD